METTTARAPQAARAYAGDVTPRDAWEMLARDAGAMLIDVRTPAEWTFSGTPDLSNLGKTIHTISWKQPVDRSVNPDFGAALRDSGAKPETPLYFLCRGGGRSRAAAIAMTAEGYTHCYNISDGFEGPLNESTRHRGEVAGWKASQLPWGQE